MTWPMLLNGVYKLFGKYFICMFIDMYLDLSGFFSSRLRLELAFDDDDHGATDQRMGLQTDLNGNID